ncbi:UNVERIFIED_CONTAM: Apoptosis-inducing factorA [Sesamum radiatum]|uniref:Apoptosis-inducing factorA n=1 Tax=Sesamum radiatum TaxID=300843 RepID=A0AAW2UQE5_SESRA
MGGVWKRVVVVGAGVAGSLIAKSLQFQADLTLIDPKEYFEIPWASLRAKVEPSFAERSLIYHKDYLTNGRLVVSKAISISDSQVLTAEGRLVTYDYLVIATGHNDPLPKTKSERLKEYQTEHERIRSASSVLIVGGGPAGVELAGEIAVDFPEKVVLVHEGSRLLEFIGPKAADKTLEWLKSKRVERGWVGRLKVDENLRVKGFKNIFAIGDITDVREIKQGYLAQKHALIAAKNLKVMMRGEKEKKMASYKPHSIKVVVSLGRQDAVAQFPLTTLIGLVPGFIKSKDLFVGKTRKQLGLDPHLVDY